MASPRLRWRCGQLWSRGWAVFEAALRELTDADLQRRVRIRGVSLSVCDALARSVPHTAYHVGQIVLLARMIRGEEWTFLSIPPGESEAYNRRPTREKGPGVPEPS